MWKSRFGSKLRHAYVYREHLVASRARTTMAVAPTTKPLEYNAGSLPAKP